MFITTNASDSVLLIASSVGIIASATSKLTSLLGYSPSELIGLPLYALLPSPYKEQLQLYLQTFAATGESTVLRRWTCFFASSTNFLLETFSCSDGLRLA